MSDESITRKRRNPLRNQEGGQELRCSFVTAQSRDAVAPGGPGFLPLQRFVALATKTAHASFPALPVTRAAYGTFSTGDQGQSLTKPGIRGLGHS